MTSVPVDVEGAAKAPDGGAAADVEHDVIATGLFVEVGARVVDHVVHAERVHVLDVRGPAHAGHDRSERVGDLHHDGADRARRAHHQHGIICRHLTVIADGLDRRRPRVREHRGLLGRGGDRRERQPVCAGTSELGEGAPAGAVHGVADGELRDGRTHLHDLAGDVGPRDRNLRSAHPVAHEPNHVREPPHEVDRPPVDARRRHSDQDLAGPHRWSVDLAEVQRRPLTRRLLARSPSRR